MNVIQDDQVIEKLSATASDPAFRDSFCHGLAGHMRTGFMLPLSAHRSPTGLTWHHRPGSLAVRKRFRECFSQLLHYPGAGRVFRHIEMEDLASTVFDCEETIQDSEGEGRHGEEVHGCDDLAVIAQESSPELAGQFPRIQAQEIPGNSAFGDIEAEFEKLAVNSRSAPGRILLRHPLDESLKLGIDLWPAEAPWARSQAPEQPEASPMPGDNGFRFYNEQDIAPCRPKTAEQNPKYLIRDAQRRTRLFSLEYTQLLTQGKDIEPEVVAGTEEGAETGEQADENSNNGPRFKAQGPS